MWKLYIFFYIMQMCSLLRTIFYGIKMVPLTTLAAMKIGFDLITHPKLAMALVNLRFSLIFYILLVFMNMQMR